MEKHGKNENSVDPKLGIPLSKKKKLLYHNILYKTVKKKKDVQVSIFAYHHRLANSQYGEISRQTLQNKTSLVGGDSGLS